MSGALGVPFHATVEDVRPRTTGSGEHSREVLEIRLHTSLVKERAAELLQRYKTSVRVSIEDVQLSMGDGPES